MRITGTGNIPFFWLAFAVAIPLWAAIGQAEDPDLGKLKVAAEHSDPEAEFTLAQAYDKGKGVSSDPKKAFEYYRRAAEHGSAKAQNNLASLYFTGSDGVKANKIEARKWLRKAAEQGAALSQDNLGLILAEEDNLEASKWFERAAEQGLLSAQLHLANIYYNGDNGVRKDYGKALKWLRKAAAQNSPWAENVLGVLYLNGLGVERDPGTAAQWFQSAAEKGDAKAQSSLGQMYCAGNGMKIDPAEGYKWLTLGAEQGEITAVKFLADFQTGMTPDQIAEGKSLVDQYKQSHSQKRSLENKEK